MTALAWIGGPEWPRKGRCGACGRLAREFPSKRWEHVGVPCRARSQPLWWVIRDFLAAEAESREAS